MKQQKESEKKQEKPNNSGNNHTSNHCNTCSKSFGSRNKMHEHMATKKHQQREDALKEREKQKLEKVENNMSITNTPNNVTVDKEKVKETPDKNWRVCFADNEGPFKNVEELLAHLKAKYYR